MVVATYEHFTRSAGRLAREIEKKNDESDEVEVQQHDFSTPKMLIAFNFVSSDKVDEVDDRTQFSNVYGQKEADKREARLANKQVNTSRQSNIESAIEEQNKQIISKNEVLAQRDVEGKPMGSGSRRLSIDKFANRHPQG